MSRSSRRALSTIASMVSSRCGRGAGAFEHSRPARACGASTARRCARAVASRLHDVLGEVGLDALDAGFIQRMRQADLLPASAHAATFAPAAFAAESTTMRGPRRRLTPSASAPEAIALRSNSSKSSGRSAQWRWSFDPASRSRAASNCGKAASAATRLRSAVASRAVDATFSVGSASARRRARGRRMEVCLLPCSSPSRRRQGIAMLPAPGGVMGAHRFAVSPLQLAGHVHQAARSPPSSTWTPLR